MASMLRDLDALLRGERTTAGDSTGSPAGIALPVGRMVILAVVLGGIYGFFMGWFRAASGKPDGWEQIIASTIKLPLLFLLTLLVTFPSLYVFNCLVGARLGFVAMLRLLVGTIVVNLAIAASLGPILAFFTFSTTSYPFMVLLNVGLLAVAGFVALGFLWSSLQRLAARRDASAVATPPQATSPQTLNPTPPPQTPSPGLGIFYIWVIIYGAVGTQMGWLLRPFIGHPDAVFQIFRPRSGSVLAGIVQALSRLTGQ